MAEGDVAAVAGAGTGAGGALRFRKPFTQQEPISEAAIARAVEVMRSGRLHRYNALEGEIAEAALLEESYADWQGARYCLACASGGYALRVALLAAGLRPGEPVLANAYTLAPVPGAIHGAGGVPVFVEIGRDWRIDPADLDAKAAASGARFLMLSHMRGHIADMDAVTAICEARGIAMVEDCAHTMGAAWGGKRSGNFGRVAAFSTQTYKHLNSGEGGILTTDDAEIAARAIVTSGSYMLYERHRARPPAEVFERIRLDTPNYSGRMDNLRAAILRAELPLLDGRIARWNALYAAMEEALADAPGIEVVPIPERETHVGSSFQFHATGPGTAGMPAFLLACARRGVELKWFGAEAPAGFTSRFDSWRYLGAPQALPRTLETLATTVDLRLPLTFGVEDCRTIAAIIAEEAGRVPAAEDWADISA
ncbi:MAG: aminotransferase class I/II-fold pyridoxal phosphate-dependent enzyme [Pseudomonadota bacterium]